MATRRPTHQTKTRSSKRKGRKSTNNKVTRRATSHPKNARSLHKKKQNVLKKGNSSKRHQSVSGGQLKEQIQSNNYPEYVRDFGKVPDHDKYSYLRSGRFGEGYYLNANFNPALSKPTANRSVDIFKNQFPQTTETISKVETPQKSVEYEINGTRYPAYVRDFSKVPNHNFYSHFRTGEFGEGYYFSNAQSKPVLSTTSSASARADRPKQNYTKPGAKWDWEDVPLKSLASQNHFTTINNSNMDNKRVRDTMPLTSVEEIDQTILEYDEDGRFEIDHLRLHPAPNKVDLSVLFDVSLYRTASDLAYKDKDSRLTDKALGSRILPEFNEKNRYLLVFTELKLAIVVFKGTNILSMSDLHADLCIATQQCFTSARWPNSLIYCDRVIQAFPTFRFVATGHSLGGTLATYVGGLLFPQWSVVTFNLGTSLLSSKGFWPDDMLDKTPPVSDLGGPFQYHFRCAGDLISGRFPKCSLFKYLHVFDIKTTCGNPLSEYGTFINRVVDTVLLHGIQRFDLNECLAKLYQQVQPWVPEFFAKNNLDRRFLLDLVRNHELSKLVDWSKEAAEFDDEDEN